MRISKVFKEKACCGPGSDFRKYADSIELGLPFHDALPHAASMFFHLALALLYEFDPQTRERLDSGRLVREKLALLRFREAFYKEGAHRGFFSERVLKAYTRLDEINKAFHFGQETEEFLKKLDEDEAFQKQVREAADEFRTAAERTLAGLFREEPQDKQT